MERIFWKTCSSPMGAIFAILILGVVVYSNSLHNSFHFDDTVFITDNFFIRDISNLQGIWNFWPCRFITFLSFALNYHFYRYDVFTYHLFNLAVHLGSSLLVWWLVRLTFLTPAMKGREITRWADLMALFIGLIFVAHPLQTQAVTFIWQRAASLAAFFYLAALCFYVKFRLQGKGNQARAYYLAALLSAVLAMFTKEIAITLPLMILLYEFCFFRGGKNFDWKPLLPLLLTILIIPLTWFFSDAEKIQSRHSFVGDISPGAYFLTELRVILTYARLILLPLHQNLDYDYRLSAGMGETGVLSGLLFVIALFVLGVRMFARYRLVSFAIFAFLLTLLPESTFFPFADVIEEHRLYLPMVGASVCIVSAAYYLLGKTSIKLMAVVLGLAVVCNSILTYHRNMVWKDNFTLWGDTIRKSPNKARPYNNRGSAYLDQGRYTEALADFNRAIALNPRYEDAYFNRGLLYDQQGDLSRALSDYNSVIKINPNHVRVFNSRGNLYVKEGRLAQALSDYDKAIQINPNYAEAYNNRGNVYAREGNVVEALADYDKAIAIFPGDAEAYNNMGIIYSRQGDYFQAVLAYNKAIMIQPDYAQAYNNRGLAYVRQSNFDQAISDYNKAIEENPDYAEAYYNLAVTYYQKGEYDNAWTDVQKAAELGLPVNPDFISALKAFREQL